MLQSRLLMYCTRYFYKVTCVRVYCALSNFNSSVPLRRTGAMAEKGKKDGGSAFGQELPPLYRYLKGILKRYPGGQIFKVSRVLHGIQRTRETARP